jgi:cytochrome P450
MISVMIASADDAAMTNDEVVSSCVLMLFGGQETTANLIGNGFLALMRNPAQLRRLQAEPELARSAVDESLRYDGPVGAIVRVVEAEHELAGKTLRRGDRVFAMINAANRDPQQFEDPDRFDIGRSPNRHITFGQGRHFCLGAPLAKIEGEIALQRLATRLDRPEIAAEALNWRDGLNMRGVTSLPIRFGDARNGKG